MATSRNVVVGTAPAKKRRFRAKNVTGFEGALENALAKLSKDWGVGEFKDVRVEYRANISVTNPGTVDTYIVVLSLP